MNEQDLVRELELRIKLLEQQNVMLRMETEEVATANVNAAMQLVELSEARASELEAKNLEIARALRAAEQASQHKSRFLANIGHELRTPISGILGLTELLASGPMSRLQRDYVDAIATTADSFLELINQLLDFSKVEAGKIEIEHVRFDLWATIENVVQLLQVRAAQKGVDLAFQLDAALPRFLFGDSLRLRQILLNLGTNAVKFTDKGMVVVVAEACVMPDGAPGIELRVDDTGCGFSHDIGKRLFEPFVQADASTSRRFGGTGLGLAICRHLVECMHGELHFVSEPSVGSTFTIRLPVEAAAAEELAPLPPRRVRLSTVRPMTQRMLAQHLVLLGCEVLGEDDVGPADLLAVEVAGDPIDAVRRARTQWGAEPILLFECSGTQVLDSELEQLGIVGVMSRPTRPSRLYAMLSEAGWKAPAERRADDACAGLRVLVAEDTEVSRRVLEAHLRNLGCHVNLVADGEQAIARWREGAYDVVFMDCQMPGVDGYEATQRMRAEEAATGRRRTPVIALTANAESGNREQCLAAGMDDFCTKPLRATALRELLQRLVPMQQARP